MTYTKYIRQLKENIEWLVTSAEYFEDQLSLNKATQEDKQEVLDILKAVRKDLNNIMAKTRNIVFITKEK